MNNIVLYHGGIQPINKPICAFGRDGLDFGKGFYLTDLRQQAEAWAYRVASQYDDSQPILNIYNFDKMGYISDGSSCIFSEYDERWLQFIVDSRTGKEPWSKYDYIEGGVANDRVIDTVNLYLAGLMDLQTALGRLSMHRPNNQICLLNQTLTDKHLKFQGYECLQRPGKES